MQIAIIIDGSKREYGGTPEELLNRDWNERVNEQIESMVEHEANKDKPL